MASKLVVCLVEDYRLMECSCHDLFPYTGVEVISVKGEKMKVPFPFGIKF